ncbi:ABC transporter ATP-binding protein [bacterium]|nr:ABC transporter ATP-binding protein [bacterium]
MSSARPVLSLRGVTKHFGGVRAVDGISLDVGEGSITGIIGPNGSGKTTLFNLISGIYEPQKGDMIFEDRPVQGLPAHQVLRRGIARTFQNIRLFDQMLVIENLLVGMHTRLFSGVFDACARTRRFWAEERAAAAEAMKLLNFFPELAEMELQIVKNLSYANRRRVEILRALAARPRLMLLDEPAAGMNATEAAKLMKDIRRIRDRGVTVLLIEHNMSVMAGVTDRVMAMDQGEKVAEGSFEEIRAHPKVLASYLGSENP